jgi:hypothetical protein
MEHFPVDTSKVPDQQQGRGLFRWLRRALGKTAAPSVTREDKATVSSQSRTAPATTDGSNDKHGRDGEGIDVDAMVKAALERHHEATKGEAGRPEGRIVPELVVGEQRYPDPRIWGPDIDESLTENEQYGWAAEVVERLDARTGFDGRQRR